MRVSQQRSLRSGSGPTPSRQNVSANVLEKLVCSFRRCCTCRDKPGHLLWPCKAWFTHGPPHSLPCVGSSRRRSNCGMVCACSSSMGEGSFPFRKRRRGLCMDDFKPSLKIHTMQTDRNCAAATRKLQQVKSHCPSFPRQGNRWTTSSNLKTSFSSS